MLSARQRFELEFLCATCAEHFDPAAARFTSSVALGVMAAYALAERIEPEHFTARDRELFEPGFIAAAAARVGLAAAVYERPPAGATGTDVVRAAPEALRACTGRPNGGK